jgi:adenosine deaminase
VAGARDSGPLTAEVVRALPKLDLHCHLDGAARTRTLLELGRGGGVELPADSEEALRDFVRVSPGCRSLREFLATFESFYPVLQLPGAMHRLARELIEDAAADGVVHVEVRFCPELQAGPGHPAQQVVEEVLDGLRSAAAGSSVSWGVIICCYRALAPMVNERMVDLALAFADRGVVGVDLAGPEDVAGRPFAPALRRARASGLPVTVHAGEAAGPASVREAVEEFSADRLGHAVALREDQALSERVRDAGIALECCLTSNLATGAVSGLDSHPLDALRRAGHRVTLNTDDPAVCDTTLTDEYLLAARTWGYGLDDLRGFSLAAVEAAFVDDAERARLRSLVSPERDR